jgi:hypothetical protein
MSQDHDKPAKQPPEAVMNLGAADLCDIETYFRQEGCSEFVYDAELDLFRFPKDGRFAFCEEFADWKRVRERGYLDFRAVRVTAFPSSPGGLGRTSNRPRPPDTRGCR